MCSFVYKSCFCKLIICSVYILVIVDNALMCSFLLQHEKSGFTIYCLFYSESHEQPVYGWHIEFIAHSSR